MIDPIQHITELFAGDRAIREASLTGRPGTLPVIPSGWAEVTIWPAPGADEFGAEPRQYTGPILFEEESQIALEIGGERWVWDKADKRVTIRYGSGVAA